ncbi:MAG TPA: M23 family metallopeptidase [Elusimicrobiota bacterium]|nr:M23 family metallopeptidase [Elusimicrobiota bacterium]
MTLSFWHRWRKEFARRLTIMVIPHGIARPRQLSFSVSFLLFLFLCWTGVTAWAGYMASQRFDYWRLKANTHVLRIKVEYFANEVKRAREMLDDVKEMETQLRTMMGMGSRDAIIQSEENPLQNQGGPTAGDEMELQKLLDGRVSELTLQDVSLQIHQLRQEMDQRLSSFSELTEKIDYERRLFRSLPNIWPTNGYLTSHFGHRLSPFSGLDDWHKGVDIAAPPGSPVHASADGVVILAGWAGGYGKVVVVDHGYGYSTRYGHNRQILVKRGDRVRRGQILSLVGSTGNATGPHCHYEVWFLGRPVNPRRFMHLEG